MTRHLVAALAAAVAVWLWPWGPMPVVPGRDAGAGRPPSGRVGGGRRWTGRSTPRRSRRWQGGADEVVLALELFAAALRAGLPVEHAWAVAVEESALPDLGAGPASALAEPRHHDRLQIVGRAWRLADQTGVPVADAVETSIDLLRSAEAARRRREVAAAGPRATARLLTLLPLGGPLVAWGVGLSPGEVYLSSSLIMWACLAGVLLLGVGHIWCARLIARAGRADGAALAVADSLDLLALALSGGCSVTAALRAVASDAPTEDGAALLRVVAALEWGQGWPTAWSQAGDRWAPAARSLRLADRVGASPSLTLRRAAGDLRARVAVSAEMVAARLGVTLVLPLGLTFLPAFALLVVVPIIGALASGSG